MGLHSQRGPFILQSLFFLCGERKVGICKNFKHTAFSKQELPCQFIKDFSLLIFSVCLVIRPNAKKDFS